MSDRRGFTIVEVVIAILVLTVGILGLASTAALVTRLIGEGGSYSQSTTLATEQMEILRSQCGALHGGNTTKGAYSIEWSVTDLGEASQVTVKVTAPQAGRSARVDTFTTTIPNRSC